MKQRMIAKHEIYNSMEELRNDYHTSPCNGVVYQMSKNNIFSGFVFIKEVM